jgi:copper chaperone CopZ
MTLVDTTFMYGATPKEKALRAINDIKEVYGIHRVSLDHNSRTIHVEYDASHLSEDDVAALLRDAGVELQGRVWEA